MMKIARKIVKNRLTKFLFRTFVPGNIRTALTWNTASTTLHQAYWANFPVVRKTYQKRVTGDANTDLFAFQIGRRVSRFGRVLAFGDGCGMATTAASQRKDTEEVVYFNLSQGEGARFINLFTSKSFPFPFRFIKGDANRFDFTSLGFFDTIIDVGVFHHLKNFEWIFPRLNRILKPDGLFYIDEFVGPSRFDYGPEVLDPINNWLATLPEELIRNRLPVTVKDYFRLRKNSSDPSESIRSGELDDWLRKSFSVIEVHPFNGTLLHPFFLTHCFDPPRLHIDAWRNSIVGEAELEKMARLEDETIAAGKLPAHFLFYVLGKK